MLQPELLDSLPPDHPDALHNRRDLRWTNWIAGSHRWIERTLPALVADGERILEIGAGTGELGLRLNNRHLAVDGLDTWPRPAGWPANRQWHVADLRTFEGYARYNAVIGNLIFHQFSSEDLAALGEKLRSGPRIIVASEPERRRTSQILYRTLAPVLGANHVTLHDAHVSIAAGFRGDELARALGFRPGEWEVRCTTSFLGMNRMIAVRRGGK